AVGQVLVRRLDLGDRRHAREGVREGVDAGGAQLLELAPPGRDEVGAVVHRRQGTAMLAISSLRTLPEGRCTSTASPRLWPSSALPTGDSLESRLGDADGSASVEPSIMKTLSLPPSSWTDTVTPTRTMLSSSSAWLMTVADRSFSSSEAIRASSIICS